MRFMTSCAALFFLAFAAQAQVTTKNAEPTGAVTPDDMSRRLDESAQKIRKTGAAGADRAAQIDFAWAQDEEEYRALAKYVIVLVCAVSKNEKELPLKRVYIRDKWRHEVPLERISSELREVPKDSAVYSVFGAYREDSFYLAPAQLMKGEGEVVADFAANRSGFRLYGLPAEAPDFVEADRHGKPARGAKPEPKALKAMLEREYSGFKLPDGLQ